jgi:hypothetical protein
VCGALDALLAILIALSSYLMHNAMVGGKNKTAVRNATPPEFRDVLLSIARMTHNVGANRPSGAATGDDDAR